MNAGRDLMKRLLHLFPVSVVKEGFNKTGTSEAVLEQVTAEHTQTVLKTFAFDNYTQTRQNIYIYRLDEDFQVDQFVNADFPIPVEVTITHQDEFRAHCLPRTRFRVMLGRNGDRQDLLFLQPVTVRIHGDILIIHFTKLVRNISHYFPIADNPLKLGQDNQEPEILAQILGYFAAYHPEPLDINAGVKHLWEIDDVDSYKIHWRRDFSHATETMDGTMTFKQQYPEHYLDIIQRPLEKTVFKYLLNDGYLCDEFTTEPAVGKISINQFPSNLTQAQNVVSKVLDNN